MPLLDVDEPTRVRLQGRVLTLKPNTPANVRAAEAYFADVLAESEAALQALGEAAVEHPDTPVADLDLPPMRTPWEINRGLLDVIVRDEDREALGEIDFDAVSADALHAIRQAFLPAWKRTSTVPATSSTS